MGSSSEVYNIAQFDITVPEWANLLALTSIAMSLVVNALMTGLIVFKIFKVYREVKPLYTQNFSTMGRSKLQPIIFAIIESGMALFAIQLAYLVVYDINTQAASDASIILYPIYEMLIVIISLVILTYKFTDNVVLN